MSDIVVDGLDAILLVWNGHSCVVVVDVLPIAQIPNTQMGQHYQGQGEEDGPLSHSLSACIMSNVRKEGRKKC